MRFGIFLLLAFFLVIVTSYGQEDKLNVCFTGDVMLDRAVKYKIDHRGFFYFADPIDSLLNGYNFRVVNLECPLSRVDKPLEKKYSFGVDSSMVEILKRAGITHAGIANNHINDQQTEGALNTIALLQKNGVVPFGYYNSSTPAVLESNGVRMALFAGMQLNVSEEEKQNICPYSDLVKIVASYKREHPRNMVVCFLHWGIEYQWMASKEQVNIAHQLIDSGADIIVGHHPHVVQTIEFYNHKPIFYSLGNLVFDQLQPEAKLGFVLGVSANGNSVEYKVSPYSINDFRPVALEHEAFEAFGMKLLCYSNGIELKLADGGWLVTEKKARVSDNINYSLEICDANFCGDVLLEKLDHLEGYRLKIEDTITGQKDELHLKFPIYRFDCADIDGDGYTDILAGVVKSTHFEPELDRRLFIFRIDSFQIRPLWLGSKLCQELIDFSCVADEKKNHIVSLEKTRKELYCIGIYKWQNFGLQLVEYKYSNLDYQTALNYFEHEK